MRDLDFIAEVIGSIAWPVVVLAAIILLRRPLTDVIRSVAKIKLKDIEVEFNRAREASVILSLDSPSPKPSVMPDVPVGALDDQIADLITTAPAAAVLLAWTSVDAALAAAVTRLAISPDSPSYRSSRHNIDQLVQHAGMPDEIAAAIDSMRQLRNKVAHDSRAQAAVSVPDARWYAETSRNAIGWAASLIR